MSTYYAINQDIVNDNTEAHITLKYCIYLLCSKSFLCYLTQTLVFVYINVHMCVGLNIDVYMYMHK